MFPDERRETGPGDFDGNNSLQRLSNAFTD
jgi:hypothetical protein